MLQRANLEVGRRCLFNRARHFHEELSRVCGPEKKVLIALANQRGALTLQSKLLVDGLHHDGLVNGRRGGRNGHQGSGVVAHTAMVANAWRAVNPLVQARLHPEPDLRSVDSVAFP
jgi:hypothetical protein